jgi:hypothetical protein
MLDAVTLDAMLIELPVVFKSFFPVTAAGIVLFI